MMRSPLLKLVIAICVSVLSQSVFADDMEDAVSAMRIGNFSEAYCIIRPYADAGDAEAQYNIGWMYLNGYGLAINDEIALHWWQLASDQGYADASFSMAMLYSLGEGNVSKDMRKAVDYYLLAVSTGHEDAQLIIKSMLERNDRAIRDRQLEIINSHGDLLGIEKQVRVKRANIRTGPDKEKSIVTRLEQGRRVYALSEKGKWTHIAVKDNGVVAWVFSSLLEAIPEIILEEPMEMPMEQPGIQELPFDGFDGEVL